MLTIRTQFREPPHSNVLARILAGVAGGVSVPLLALLASDRLTLYGHLWLTFVAGAGLGIVAGACCRRLSMAYIGGLYAFLLLLQALLHYAFNFQP